MITEFIIIFAICCVFSVLLLKDTKLADTQFSLGMNVLFVILAPFILVFIMLFNRASKKAGL